MHTGLGVLGRGSSPTCSTKQVQAKANCVPDDIEYQILYKDDIQECLTYCKEKYGKEFWKTLYDK